MNLNCSSSTYFKMLFKGIPLEKLKKSLLQKQLNNFFENQKCEKPNFVELNQFHGVLRAYEELNIFRKIQNKNPIKNP